jgi:uncharacterized Zn-finger protein
MLLFSVRVGGTAIRDLHNYLVNKDKIMAKEVDKKICSYCESDYKLMYDLDNTSGHPKFCPFCASDVYEEQVENEEDED